MLQDRRIHKTEDIEFSIIYSRRRTLGISVLPDSRVIVRVPWLTSMKTINRIVQQKASWIIKHRDNYRRKEPKILSRLYADGEKHFFRGDESLLIVGKAAKPFIRFNDNLIELGIDKPGDNAAVKKLLYRGYKNEARKIFPALMEKVIEKHKDQMFKPTGLVIRTMKSRWGSCSNKGVITLSTELIKLPDLFIEYVIIHELCHLRHHNHGPEFYSLLAELYPEWKETRKELRKYIQLK